MRIGEELPFSYIHNPAPIKNPAPDLNMPSWRESLWQEPPKNQGGTGIIVDISPAGWAASSRTAERGISEALRDLECNTCNSRSYRDISNDSSVSFQSPTHLSPGPAASAVAAHEAEHVANEKAYAERDGREIISQTVRLMTSICPECKITYVSGGETRTVSKAKVDIEV